MIEPADRSAAYSECGREDSNLQGVAPTTTSTLRVCQFRHARLPADWCSSFREIAGFVKLPGPTPAGRGCAGAGGASDRTVKQRTVKQRTVKQRTGSSR